MSKRLNYLVAVAAAAVVSASIIGQPAYADVEGIPLPVTETVLTTTGSGATVSTTTESAITVSTQTAADLKDTLNNRIQDFKNYKDLTANYLVERLNYLIDNNDLTIRIDDFLLTPSTTTVAGSATGTIFITDKANSNSETPVPFNLELPLAQSAADLEVKIKNRIPSLAIYSTSTSENILRNLSYLVDNKDLTLRIDNYLFTPSTAKVAGSATGKIVIIDGADSNSETSVPFNIALPLAQSAADLETLIKNRSLDFTAYNNSTSNTILDQIDYLVRNQDLKLRIDNFVLNKSTATVAGSATGTIAIIDGANSNSETLVPFNIALPLAQSAANLEKQLNDKMQILTVDNYTTSSNLLRELNYAIENKDLTLRIDNFVLTKSTATVAGSVTGTVVIIDGSNSNSETLVPFNIKVSLAQSAENLEKRINDRLQNLSLDNYVTDSGFVSELSYLIENKDLTLRIDSFALTKSTSTVAGSATGTIVIIDGANSNSETSIPFNVKVSLAQSSADLETKIKNRILDLTVDNNSTSEDILNRVNYLVSNKGLTLRVDNFALTKSTTTSSGSATGTIVIIDTDNSNSETLVPFNIKVSLVQSLADLEKQINSRLNYLNVTNKSTSKTILNQISSLVNNEDLKLRVDDFVLTKSTTTKLGSATGTIVIIDGANSNSETLIKFSTTVPLIQSATDLEKEIKNRIQDFDVDNNTIDCDILDEIKFLLDNTHLKVIIDNFVLTKSTTKTVGSVTCTIVIIDTDNSSNQTLIQFNKEIPLAKELSALESSIKDEIEYLKIDNDTTDSDILEELSSLVDNKDLKLRVDNFVLTKSTTKAVGSAKGTIVIIDGANSNSETLIKFNKEVPLAQTIANLEKEMNNRIENIDIDNNITVKDLVRKLKREVDNEDLKLRIDNFVLTKSTTTSVGSATGTIVITDGANSNSEISIKFNKEVPLAKTASKLEEAINDKMNNLVIDNNTTDSDILDDLNKLVDNTDLTLKLDGFVLTKSTTAKVGSAIGTIVITDASNSNKQTSILFNVEVSLAKTASELKLAIRNHIYSLDTDNNMTTNDIIDHLSYLIDNKDLTLRIDNLVIIPATTTTFGSATGTIVIIDTANGNKETSLTFSEIISKITSDNSSGGSSSGGGSKHSSSGGGSSSSSSPNTTTSKSTSTTNDSATTAKAKSILTSDGTAAVTKESISKAISTIGLNNVVDTETAKEITNEVAKVVTENVVSNLTTVVGKGVIASEAKEVTAADGNKIAVTTLTKDGKCEGAVITTEKASAIATIPVDKAAGEVKAVYKFVPLLGKYIQLTEGVTIGTDAVTLPTQANAVYYAATETIAATETVTQGWAKVDNNWYMVNATGDPQTGWQKDSTGNWTYLAPDNGVMKTGWLKTGDTWYHLGENGYMSTGWLKTGDTWYYLNSDGSMAANTTIDGYKLDSNGAWIR